MRAAGAQERLIVSRSVKLWTKRSQYRLSVIVIGERSPAEAASIVIISCDERTYVRGQTPKRLDAHAGCRARGTDAPAHTQRRPDVPQQARSRGRMFQGQTPKLHHRAHNRPKQLSPTG